MCIHIYIYMYIYICIYIYAQAIIHTHTQLRTVFDEIIDLVRQECETTLGANALLQEDVLQQSCRKFYNRWTGINITQRNHLLAATKLHFILHKYKLFLQNESPVALPRILGSRSFTSTGSCVSHMGTYRTFKPPRGMILGAKGSGLMGLGFNLKAPL